ncbi:TRAP transporter small permease [Mesorhizobium sp.]|uniref:TRAP transporter small permease n=1 Tax=Mesorhizobium sp. TaxID=1871066 RepID=UPI000FE7A76B|nr:TRAP transporter small permease [Mesorhizobium sp.]RWK42263.1 MAG: TRAP transporter small permease [Mesorhizobium sp.]RWK69106.1 MAG: TRAP transporter small permease [Mesorhizobium sp.]RWK71822.1 MAG: TRAP transporter small permease [Mesorhizobium sp.]RWK79372.1 MAG: TRAP transporter small permease [Mesorhizobium sp.]RWL01375.1 MAG: TRAP transporter small permease [Mesorhizobium sp.]
MTRVLDAIHAALKIVLGVLVGGLLIPVSMQVLSRFTGLIPRYIWTEEIARFCFVWMIMVGAIIAVRDGSHFDLDLLPTSDSPKTEAAKRILVNLLMLVVALVFVWYGWKLVEFGWFQTSEIAALPMNWIYGAWPLAGVLFTVFILEKLVRDTSILMARAQ